MFKRFYTPPWTQNLQLEYRLTHPTILLIWNFNYNILFSKFIRMYIIMTKMPKYHWREDSVINAPFFETFPNRFIMNFLSIIFFSFLFIFSDDVICYLSSWPCGLFPIALSLIPNSLWVAVILSTDLNILKYSNKSC